MEITTKPLETVANYSVQSKSVNSGTAETGVKPVQAQSNQYSKERQLDRETVNKVTEELNKFMQLLNTDIQFSLHEKLNRLFVQVVDTRDRRVLKEFPPHELLDTLANIREYVGILLDKRV